MNIKDKLITKDEAFALTITLFQETQAKLKTAMQIIEVQGKALNFYGDIENWECPVGWCIEFNTINEDDIEDKNSIGGKTARACIKQVNGLWGKL